MTDVKLALRGLRGESDADMARRTGAYGVLPGDTDLQFQAKKLGDLADLALPDLTFATKADATAALSGIAADAVVMVFADESVTGSPRTIYRKESGSLVLRATLKTATETADDVKDLIETGGLTLAGDLLASSIFPKGLSALTFFGDSITGNSAGGFVNSTPDLDDCYAALVGARRVKTVTYAGIPGGSICDWTYPMMGTVAAAAMSVLAGAETTILPGYNDHRANGSDVGKLAAYKAALRAAAVWRAIPDAQKIFADDARVTYSGTWADTPVRFSDGRSQFTSGSGAYAEVEIEGSAVYIWVLQQTSDGASDVEITVDGVVQPDAVNLSAAIGNGGAIKWSAGVPSGETGTSINYQPHCIRIAGLSRGLHTIRITRTAAAAGNLFLDGFASNGAVARASARVYLGNTLRLNATGAAGDSPYNLATDAVNRSYCRVAEDVARELSGDGLDVRLWDANSAYNPDTDPGSDNIHPPATGHEALSVSLERCMDTAQPEYGAAGLAGVWFPVVSGLSVAGSHTYSEQEGYYDVQGRFCIAQGRVKLSAVGGTMAGATVVSLPLPALKVSPGVIGRTDEISLSSGCDGFLMEAVAGQSYAVIRQRKTGDLAQDLPVANIATDSEITFQITYMVG